ncbi:MAG: hypothetical protein DI630_08860 [Gordonia sp. (in: high G+C Gram-positive bacteria)]|nr:MAG: hypothetical protein DI630_08860 [Gordonia sp. (in: high G+C Gram-positive bacteria)]
MVASSANASGVPTTVVRANHAGFIGPAEEFAGFGGRMKSGTTFAARMSSIANCIPLSEHAMVIADGVMGADSTN